MPPHTEAVVFSVDGALVDNFSLSGRAMKCKTGAVDVARQVLLAMQSWGKREGDVWTDSLES